MTGVELKLILDQAIDKAYSGYLDDTKADRLIRRALFRMVDKIYSGADTQKELDELYSFIVKNEQHAVSTNRFAVDNTTHPYMHLLRAAFIFETPLTFTFASGVFTSTGHNLRVGDTVVLAGATDVDSNGSYTVTRVKPNKFYIPLTYVDGTLTFRVLREATPKWSDRKHSPLHRATEYSPKYEQVFSDNFSVPNALLLDPQPQKVEIDYMMLPDQPIESDNNAVDLLNYYTEKFLYRLIDECVLAFAEETRDPQTRQVAAQTIVDNP